MAVRGLGGGPGQQGYGRSGHSRTQQVPSIHSDHSAEAGATTGVARAKNERTAVLSLTVPALVTTA
jgi:hypothetical protein